MDRYSGGVPSTGTLRPRGWYPEPRNRGGEARATRAHYGSWTTNRVAPVEPVYPPERLRLEETREEEFVYDRADTQVVTALAATASFTFIFSGVADAIDLMGTQEYSVAFLDQNLVRIGGFGIVPANQVYSTTLSARSIVIQNLGAAAGDFAVIPKWRRRLPLQPLTAPVGAPP